MMDCYIASLGTNSIVLELTLTEKGGGGGGGGGGGRGGGGGARIVLLLPLKSIPTS